MRDFDRNVSVSTTMSRAVPTLAGCIALALTACNSPAYDAFAAQQEKYASSSASSGEVMTTGEVVTTGVVDGSSGGSTSSESTSGGMLDPSETAAETSGSATTTTGGTENTAPKIAAFTASPDEIFEAGEVKLEIEASDDVVEVDVWYGDVLLATVPIEAFPYHFDVTSQTVCDGSQSFKATVRDAEGLTDTVLADLYCQLPAPGSEVYTRILPGTSASSGAAVVALPDGAVIVAGGLDGRMALWRLDPEGNVLQGWPKTLAGWTATPGLAAKESTATAVGHDSTGAIVVGGTIQSGTTTRRYLAKLSDKGALLWEDPGLKDGEDIAGLAVSAGLDVVAAGSCRTSPLDQAPAYDACTWGYPKGYPKQAARWSDQFKRPDTDPLPDPPNIYSERVRAVVARDSGDFVVLGEREYKDGDFKLYTRAMAQRYTANGARDGALWTSPGLKVAHDAILAATITPTGILATGWCRHEAPKAVQQICVQEFDAGGALVGFFVETSPSQAEARGVAQDRERKMVISGFTTKPGQTDAWIFGSRGADQPLGWSQTYDEGGWDFAMGVGCDLWSHCTWVGTTAKDGALALVVSRRHP